MQIHTYPRLRRRDLLAQGIGDHGLRLPVFRRPAHGWYTPSGEDADLAMTRILDAAARLPPGAALGGWAAGHLLGADYFDGRSCLTGRLLPVPIVVPAGGDMRPNPGLRVRHERLDDSDRAMVGGIPLTNRLRTGFDFARTPGPEMALAGVDCLLHAHLLTVDELAEFVARHPRWRGVPQARLVVGLADGAAASPQESRLRYVWVVEVGLPRPRVNVPTFSSGSGAFLAIPDLLDEQTGLVGEYDGAGHREATQHGHDNAREELMEHHGLTVVRAMSADLGSGRLRLQYRLARGHERAAQTRRRLWTFDGASGTGATPA